MVKFGGSDHLCMARMPMKVDSLCSRPFQPGITALRDRRIERLRRRPHSAPGESSQKSAFTVADASGCLLLYSAAQNYESRAPTKATSQRGTTMLYLPPARSTVASLPTVVNFPLIVALPANGRLTVPLVPAGTSRVRVKALWLTDHFTPYHPRGVWNPPSAEGRPERCGATDQVLP